MARQDTIFFELLDDDDDDRGLREQAARVAFNLQHFSGIDTEKALGKFLDAANLLWIQNIKEADPLLWDRWDCELDEYGRLIS